MAQPEIYGFLKVEGYDHALRPPAIRVLPDKIEYLL